MSYPPQPPPPNGPPAGGPPPGGQQPPGGQPPAPQFGSQAPQPGQQPPQYPGHQGQQGQPPPQYPGQAPQYGGQDPYATGTGAPKPKSKMPLIGKILTFIGAGILALTIIGGIIMTIAGASSLSGFSDEAIRVNGTTNQFFEAESEWQVYVPEDSGFTSCTITGPTPVSKGTNQTSSYSFDGRTYESIDGFSVQEAGTYSITCNQPDVIIAPPLSVGGIFSTVGGILIAVFGGLLGVGLTILGIVLWIVGRKRAQRA
ncbi:hypothetical protein [Brevibacterium otitidis]|uniref:Uncharacterized protein n=1 Tax=Brevibacterium otitidis TaxID=53364 RepID=A0ABV5X1H4_9MICO|nr:hypothetical protein GCM10023233_27910 [Brevibacterium otitidis]